MTSRAVISRYCWTSLQFVASTRLVVDANAGYTYLRNSLVFEATEFDQTAALPLQEVAPHSFSRPIWVLNRH